MRTYDLVIVGGGISGMTAALAALKSGIKEVLLLEREARLGGMLNQCIHNNFGKRFLGSSVTGPEYISYIEDELEKFNIDIKVNTEVLDISADKILTYVNPEDGVVDIKARAIILATGCREKYTGSIAVPTNRFTGIYTIGDVHRIVNLDGYLPGKNLVIVVNNMWSLIVARRLIVEGANIKALIVEDTEEFIYERDSVDIMKGFPVPIITNYRVVEVYGRDRIEGASLYNEETGEISNISCDALILSVKYMPETELARKLKIEINNKTLAPVINDYETDAKGIFACGNLIYGNNACGKTDIDGYDAGEKTAEYIKKFIY